MSGSMNKMLLMVPVMLAARRLDGDDPLTIYYVRIAYGVMQALCVLVVLYVYSVASATHSSSTVVYVPPPPQPFADPNAKKKYTEIQYGQHVIGTARSLVGSTLFGICLTCGLHYYKGMLVGLAIQVVMAPVNLWENKLVMSILQGVELVPFSGVFEEKQSGELEKDADIVDPSGQPVVTSRIDNNSNGTESLESILLDTWDAGSRANLNKLQNALSVDTINTATSADGWTALMIVAGLKSTPGASDCLQVLLNDYQADTKITDKDGWTALHWAAFHGSVAGARALADRTELKSIVDKEGKTALETAQAENNLDVVQVLQESKKSK